MGSTSRLIFSRKSTPSHNLIAISCRFRSRHFDFRIGRVSPPTIYLYFSSSVFLPAACYYEFFQGMVALPSPRADSHLRRPSPVLLPLSSEKVGRCECERSRSYESCNVENKYFCVRLNRWADDTMIQSSCYFFSVLGKVLV